MSGLLSEAELTYTVHGVQDNVREDGRTCQDYRHIELETGVLNNAQGSCKLSIGCTDVLVRRNVLQVTILCNTSIAIEILAFFE